MGSAQLGETVTAHDNGTAKSVRLQAAWRGHLVREDVKHVLLVFNGTHEAQMRMRDFYARGISWDQWHAGRRRYQRRRQERDSAAAHSSSLLHALPSPPTTSSLTVPLAHAGCNGSHLTVSALGAMNGVENRDRRANFLSRALSVEHPEPAAVLRQQEDQEERVQRAAAHAPRALSLYGRRPPGIHSHHATRDSESDESESQSEAGDGSEEIAVSSDEAAACAKAEAEADEQIFAAAECLGELEQAVMRWLLTDAGWSTEEVADSCTVHGESDGDAPGFYWAADDNRDPYWWSGYGFRMAGTFATLGANGLHIHQLSPQTPAQMRRLRAEWAQAARVDADASMSRGTAMRAARRAAEAEADDEAAEEQEEDVDELLLGCI